MTSVGIPTDFGGFETFQLFPTNFFFFIFRGLLADFIIPEPLTQTLQRTFDANTIKSLRLMVLRLMILRLMVLRLMVLRLMVLRLMVLRLMVLRLMVLRFLQ